MVAIVQFIFFVINTALSLFLLALIISAVMSWLVAFDIINYRNRVVASLAEALYRLTSPVLDPLRRIVPPIGGVDITPIIAWILIAGFQRILLPASEQALLNIVAY